MAQYTSEKFKLAYYSDGTSPYSIELGNDSVIITTDTEGKISDEEVQAATQTTVVVFRGEEEITDKCYYSWSAYSGDTGLAVKNQSEEEEAVPGWPTTNAIISLEVDGKKYDNAKLEVAVYDENKKLIGSKALTVSKSKTGAPGTPAEVYQLYIMPNIVNIDKIPEGGQSLRFGVLKVSGANQTSIDIDNKNYQIIDTNKKIIDVKNVVVNSDFTGETYQLQRYIDKKWVTVDTESVGVTYNGDEGDPARDFNVTASSYMFTKNKEGQFTNSPIKLTAHAINLGDSIAYQWSKWDNGSFINIADATKPEYNATGIGRYQCVATFGGTSMADEVNLGETLSGTDAIAINITNPTMTFNYKDADASETCQVIVMRGEEPVPFTTNRFDEKNLPGIWCYTIDCGSGVVEIDEGTITITNQFKPTSYTFDIKVYKPQNLKPVLNKTFNIQATMVSDGQNATTVLGINLSRDSDLVPANSDGIVTPEKALNGATTIVSATMFGQIQTGAEIDCEVKAIMGSENSQILTEDDYTWDGSVFTLKTWQNENKAENINGWDSVIATFTYIATPTGYDEQKVEKMFVMTKAPTEPGEKGDNAIDYELKVTPEFFNNLFICDNDKIEPPIINISVIKIDGTNQEDITSTALSKDKIKYRFGDDESLTPLDSKNLAWEYGQTSLTVKYKITEDIFISQEVNFLNNPNQNLLLNSYLDKTYQPDSNNQLVQLTLSEPISQGKYSISLREDATSTSTRKFTATLGGQKISLKHDDKNTKLYAGSFTLNDENAINTITIGLEDGDVEEATITSVKLESGIGVTPWVAAAADSVAVSIEAQYVNSLDQPDEKANWQSTIPSPVTNQYTWMRQKLSTATSWSAPIRLTGEDAGDVQYIYYLKSVDKNAPTDTPTDSDIKEAGPDEWTNNPTGIKPEFPEEYMSFKTKPSGPNTEWGPYSAPALWSKWGDKGQDGAGVIYKFCRQQNNTTPKYPSTSVQWNDNPQGVTSTWKYEYVAVIKTYYDESGNLKENTTNVSVSLWNHYVKDGDPARILELTNDGAQIDTDVNGNLNLATSSSTISVSTAAQVYDGGVAASGWTYTISPTSGTGFFVTGTKDFTISFNNYFNSTNSKEFTITATKTGESSLTKKFSVTKNRTGATGSAAVIYEIVPSVNTINVSNTNTTSFTFQVTKTTGGGTPQVVTTQNSPAILSVTYKNSTSKPGLSWANGTYTVNYANNIDLGGIIVSMGAYKPEFIPFIKNGDDSTVPGDTVTTSTITQYAYYKIKGGGEPTTKPTVEKKPLDNNNLNDDWYIASQWVSLDYPEVYRAERVKTIKTINTAQQPDEYTDWSDAILWARFGSDATVTTYNTFNALTNDGQNQGIYYAVTDNGNVYPATVTEDDKYEYTVGNTTKTANSADLYINASMIKTGTFSVSDGGYTVFSAAAVKPKDNTAQVQIGRFNVGVKTADSKTHGYLTSGKKEYNDTIEGVYLGTDGIGIGKGNYIKYDGTAKLGGFTLNSDGKASFDGIVTAKQGDIAGWQLQFSEGQNFSSLVSKDGNFQIISQDASIQESSQVITANRQTKFRFTNDELEKSFCDISTDGISFNKQGSLPITLEADARNAQVLEAYIHCVSNETDDSEILYDIETDDGWESISNVLYVDNGNRLKARKEAFTDEYMGDFYAELIVTINYQIQIPANNSSMDQAYLKIGEEREESFTYSARASADSILYLDSGFLSFKIDKKPFSTQLSCIGFMNAVIDSAVIGITDEGYGYSEITEIRGKKIKELLRINNTGSVMCNEEINNFQGEVHEAVLTIRVKYKTNNFMVSRSGKINSPTISYLLEQVGSGTGVGGDIGLNYYNKTQIDNKLVNYYNKTDFPIATEDDIKALFSKT